jgi:hypothetical protein
MDWGRPYGNHSVSVILALSNLGENTRGKVAGELSLFDVSVSMVTTPQLTPGLFKAWLHLSDG